MSLGILTGQLVVQLPLIAVLVVGLVLVSNRRATLAPRQANMAIGGLVALGVDLVLSMIWTTALPSLYRGLDLDYSRIGIISSIIGFLLTALTALGVLLLVLALVGKGPGQRMPFPPGPPPGYGTQQGPPPGYGGQPGPAEAPRFPPSA